MSVVALPSFLEQAKYQAADNHIGAVITIHDALKTYYNARLAEGVPTGTSTLFPNGCGTLVNEGILPQIPPNAWGGTFSCSMRSIDNDPYANILHKMALLEVTNVPLEMANYLTAHLPLTSCTGSTCTSSLLPPNTQDLPVRGCTIPYAANYDPNASINHDDCVCYNMKFKECGSSRNMGIGLNHICKKIDGVPVTPADLGRIVDVNSVMHWSSSPSLWEVSEVWAVPFILAYNGGTGNYMNNIDSYPAGCSQ
ncbi:MAG: hypothetical protein QGI45_08375 [Myxococcota bacterium]|nr:hypothetical protein [Myxococcota bacterium]